MPIIREMTPDSKSAFRSLIRDDTAAKPNHWVFLLYDQLNLELIPFNSEDPDNVGIILIESLTKGKRRPYHKQKLAVLLSNLRHFALEAQAVGHPVLYVTAEGTYRNALEALSDRGTIDFIRPAERETRLELEPLILDGILKEHPHRGWLTPQSWFEESVGTVPPFRMDRFYRRFRRETGVLMDHSAPIGGKFSFDAENRFPWKGEPPAPSAPTYDRDEIDLEVETLVNQQFSEHPGIPDLSVQPTTSVQTEIALQFAMSVLPNFGTYKDAMSSKSRGIFHSRLATLLNLGRLMPQTVLERALATEAPINSTEGFVRQLIWREYVHHVHEITDGFRTLEINRSSNERRDARWWDELSEKKEDEIHPNHLGQERPLPQVFWGAESGFACLDNTIQSVIEDGWTHHIPRLMVLGNLANLLDINPRELTDWFHVAFIDAYDWVVEPNVLGMGTFALGDAMMTKPYVSGTPYLNKMGDHCKGCSLDPKRTCPISKLYWAYLERHKSAFEGNVRMAMPLRSLSKRNEEQKHEDAVTFASVSDTFQRGEIWKPENLVSQIQCQ